VRRALAGAAAAVLLAAVTGGAAQWGWAAAAQPSAAVPVNEQTVYAVAAQLRCVVCQSLSVADSPSGTASQMRDLIRERLAAGDSPEQVRAYFVEKYGDWILLSPPKSGFTLLVWLVPYVGLGLGLVMVAFAVRRWSRTSRAVAPPQLDPALRERIRREISEMDK
jgi:cytochrome c-type biogenesis protein CcmH